MPARLRRPLALSALALLCAACAVQQERPPAAASTSVPGAAQSQLVSIALIMGEPNFSMDGGYQELEEGQYTQPELKPGKKMFAPIQDIIGLLGGEAQLDAASHSGRYSLAGISLSAHAGESRAERNGSPVDLGIAPEWRNGSLWLPLETTFSLFGAFPKWDEARQRFSATFILPASSKISQQASGGKITEASMTEQSAAFYNSAEGRQLADVVLGYQNADGGWPKLERTVNMLVPVNTAALTGWRGKSTIDNDSTMKQIKVLARAFSAFGDEKYRAGFNRGLDYIFAAQLANGGWQQFWPDPVGYKKRITFNDDAMANVLEVMRDIAQPTAEFRFVDTARRTRAQDALRRGIDLILKTQLVVGGKKAGWCAQYDENTLAPAMGRSYELPSISGGESVNVLRFLMSLEQPSPAVVRAVQDGANWLKAARLPGQKRIKREDRTLEMGFDYVLVKDPAAPGTWARFYDLDSGKPLFSSRDSVKRSDFAEIAYERRVKYNWFTELPRALLEQEYPTWQKRRTAQGRGRQ
ncbi:pectate lyase [Uliginosibacterium sp. TH139]|uniref:pectate lyase n=1 Tax=Uliginosibacterium sp. TH139 TaxID=2067453 RepID=UPI00130479C7|nr:pectate lyase [Uliginosibacterium sp. TH139]